MDRRKLLLLRAALGAGTSAETLTVTGASPLSLVNAIYHAILSLTQEGKCAQSGTPSQNNYVPIKCNNGELAFRDTELPVAYRRIIGMTMNDNCYYLIDNFKLTGADTLRFAFSATAACNVIGAYSGSASGNNYSLYVGTSAANYLRYKNGAYNSQVDADTRYNVTITPTGTSGLKTDSTWTQLDFETTTDLCIGTTKTDASSAKLKGAFYGNVEVENAQGLRFKGIPCIRVSDSVVGWYDTVSELFYEPVGTNPTAGDYDMTHYAVTVVGTPEALTVSASGAADQTASVANLLSLPGGRRDYQEIISGVVTRKCQVLVFDGTEDWHTSSSKTGAQWLELPTNGGQLPNAIPFCTRFKQGADTWQYLAVGECLFEGQNIAHWDIDVFSGLTDNNAFKSMLAGWYAAGTPMMMVIPAVEATEQVTPQPLNTSAGTNTVSVTAEVSGITLTAEYKGTA